MATGSSSAATDVNDSTASSSTTGIMSRPICRFTSTVRASWPAAGTVEGVTRPFLACLASLLVLAGCADAPESEAPVAEAPEPAAQPTTPPPGGGHPGTLTTSRCPLSSTSHCRSCPGGQVVGAELAGRHVALWFWTPW
jgi:hypothetical protein